MLPSFAGKYGTHLPECPLKFKCKKCKRNFGYPKKKNGKFCCPYCKEELKAG